jgi:hypothetical protein
MMEDLFVPYEQSVKLKELGFDIPCIAYYLSSEIQRTGEIILHYHERGKEIIKNNDYRWVYKNFVNFKRYLKSEHCLIYSRNHSKIVISSPTYQQAFKWFRNIHLLDGLILPQEQSICDPLPLYFIAIISYKDGKITELFNSTNQSTSLHFSTYEDAEQYLLKEMIKIVK